MVAACADAYQVIEFLLELENIDLEAKDRAGKTALDLARTKGHQVNFCLLYKSILPPRSTIQPTLKYVITLEYGCKSFHQTTKYFK
jgi:hypothetical protein